MMDDMDMNDTPSTTPAQNIDYDPITGLPILDDQRKML
jgi:hypothetical protein